MSYRFIISLSTLLKIAHYSFHRCIQLFQQLLIQSPVFLFVCFLEIHFLFIYLFIYDCVESSFLCEGFL